MAPSDESSEQPRRNPGRAARAPVRPDRDGFPPGFVNPETRSRADLNGRTFIVNDPPDWCFRCIGAMKAHGDAQCLVPTSGSSSKCLRCRDVKVPCRYESFCKLVS
jgi:hypothetical protein